MPHIIDLLHHIMDPALREFLQHAGVEDYEKQFVEKLELTKLAHLDFRCRKPFSLWFADIAFSHM